MSAAVATLCAMRVPATHLISVTDCRCSAISRSCCCDAIALGDVLQKLGDPFCRNDTALYVSKTAIAIDDQCTI